MNNLLQSLRGVLSALIGFHSPEDGLLEKARRRWNEGRTNRPSLLDEAWEERVMFAVRLSPMDDPDVPDWPIPAGNHFPCKYSLVPPASFDSLTDTSG